MKERWFAVSTITVFALALAGAVYAVYVLVPPLIAGPHLKSALRIFLVTLAVALVIIILIFGLKVKE